METETSVKITYNGDMRRFSFKGASFNALKEYVIALLGLDKEVVLKYVDEDGDLITLSSDLELKAAIVPGKVLRLQVGGPAARPVNVVPQPQIPPVAPFVQPSDSQPMDVCNPFQAFAAGCGFGPMMPPPGFHGPPHFPHHPHPHPHPPHDFPHPHPHPPHDGPFGCDKELAKEEWTKYKEECKKAKKTLSREEYIKFKEQHKAFKEAHRLAKQAHKEAKHAYKKEWKKGGRRGSHHGPHGPHGPHGRGGFYGLPHGRGGFFPRGGFHHGGPHRGMHMPPFADHETPFAPHPHPHPHGGFEGGFGGPGLYPHLGGPFGAPQQEDKLIARHVKDVTIEDGTQLPPGTAFVKTWRVRNEGPAWPAGCQLIYLSKHCGDNMSGPDFVTIEGAVNTNQEVDVSVNLIAPNKPGRYIGYWKLSTPNGRKFGQRMWVSIVVPSLGSSSSDEEERLADRYEVLVDAVLAQGYTVKRHRVFRLLEKFGGDVQAVSNVLADKAQRKEAKAALKRL